MTRRRPSIAGVSAVALAVLMGCGGADVRAGRKTARSEATSTTEAPSSASDNPGPPAAGGAVEQPPLDNGELGQGNGSASGGGGGPGAHTGSTGGGNAQGGGPGRRTAPDDGRGGGAVAIVGGPTLGDDYPEWWGNLSPSTLSPCAVFHSSAPDHQVTIRSVSVPEPFVLVTGCAPSSGAGTGAPCTSGVVLAHGSECVLGLALPPGTALARNYTGDNTWELSLTCTDRTIAPCLEAQVLERDPSIDHPVEVRWSVSRPLRFCGGTDYADELGHPGGTGTSPANGCTAALSDSHAV